MIVIAEYGNDELAKVYVAMMREADASKKHLVEFVESVQPPLPRDKKWVLIVSSMFGCPIKCRMCDAGGDFGGRLNAEEILEQIEYLVRRRYPDGRVPVPKFKIQFARMGEPSLNPAVLDAMERLPKAFNAPGLNVSMSTVAPNNPQTRRFFEKLVSVKERLYPGGRFQLQFSIHTTDKVRRNDLIPVKKWTFSEIAAYGNRFAHPETGDKKVTLNFAPVKGYPIDASAIREYFDPEKFIIKLTPLNPTVRSNEEALESAIKPDNMRVAEKLVQEFKKEGFEVVLSIGELEENKIGSNCGQFIQRALGVDNRPRQSYELERYLVDTKTK
jgi:23S rRNA (adenine2503-C2)-methyltransferase